MTQACEDVEFTQPILANVELVDVVTWIVKVVAWICQSCSMYFSPVAKKNQAEVQLNSAKAISFFTLSSNIEQYEILM